MSDATDRRAETRAHAYDGGGLLNVALHLGVRSPRRENALPLLQGSLEVREIEHLQPPHHPGYTTLTDQYAVSQQTQ